MNFNTQIRRALYLSCLSFLIFSCINPSIEDQKRKTDKPSTEIKSLGDAPNDSIVLISSLLKFLVLILSIVMTQ